VRVLAAGEERHLLRVRDRDRDRDRARARDRDRDRAGVRVRSEVRHVGEEARPYWLRPRLLEHQG
jgi:hypothetical protein